MIQSLYNFIIIFKTIKKGKLFLVHVYKNFLTIFNTILKFNFSLVYFLYNVLTLRCIVETRHEDSAYFGTDKEFSLRSSIGYAYVRVQMHALYLSTCAPALTVHSRGQSSMLRAPCCFIYRITPCLGNRSLSGGLAKLLAKESIFAMIARDILFITQISWSMKL